MIRVGPGFSPDKLLLSTEVTFYSIRCEKMSLRDMEALKRIPT